MEDRRWPDPEVLVMAQLQEIKDNYKELHKELEGIRLDIELFKQREKDSAKTSLYAFMGGLLPALGIAIYYLLS